jgi:metal-sulfur cluster biosynthetic enzyme
MTRSTGALTADEVRARLRTIDDPCSIAHRRPTDIVSFGLVDDVRGGERPRVVLRLTEPTCMYGVWFLRRIREVLGPDAEVEFAAADQIWGPPEE